MSGSAVENKPGSDATGTISGSTTGVTSSAQANAIPKAIIKNVDMSDEMQQAAVDIASDAMTKYTVEKDIAAHVKKTMDTKFGPTWHAVVGKNYGSYVTHETKHFIYFCKSTSGLAN